MASGATVATTGIRPAVSRSSRIAGSHRGDVADQAEIDGLTVDVRDAAYRGQQAGVLAGQPDRDRRRAR